MLCDAKDVVLVVDDEEVVDEMIQGVVGERGCTSVSFNNSKEALHFYLERPHNITVAITDLTMPVLSGPDLIKKMLEVNPKLPIILITGYAENKKHTLDEIRPLVHHILQKPFRASDLLDVVRTALDKADHKHPSS